MVLFPVRGQAEKAPGTYIAHVETKAGISDVKDVVGKVIENDGESDVPGYR